jgi:molybdenum ABC transporter molybdate-binding protein
MAVRDDWIIYAIFGVFVCLLLWRVATQWKVKSTEAENLRVSVVIFGVVALVLVVWQCVRQASPIAAHSQDKTITVFAAASNESTRFNLLGNVLVLIAGKDSKIDHVDIEPGFDLAKLANYGRIATGDVQEVPVGLYAKASLEKLGVWPSVESKMAMTVNVRAALAYVVRGEAPLSIVYATDAKIESGVKVVGVFPDNSHDPIIYPMAATVNAKSETIQYLALLRSAAAKSIFEGYGFSVLAKPTS